MTAKIVIALIAWLIVSLAQAQQAINWNDSPNNFQNSLDNWDNSANNFSATNGVYDNRGNRVGYEVHTKSGVTNIYSNEGKRMGYVPAQTR